MLEKTFDCIIKTQSKEERKALIDYITNKDVFIISNIDDVEGVHLVGVRRDAIGVLSLIASYNLIKDLGYMRFDSVTEYIIYSKFKKCKKNLNECMERHVTICMPDGSGLGLSISENDDFNKIANEFIKDTKENPKLHGDIVLKEKCPKCGEILHAKEYDDETRCWCPSCHYEEARKKR